VEASSIQQERVSARQTTSFMGMVFFLISEAFLFGSLFWTYYYLRAKSPVWPPETVYLDLTLASINTFFLLASSGTIWWAGRSIRKGRKNGLALGLMATLLLGSTFLGITAWEWTHETFTPWSHAYGSIFFTLTGFHALHVFAGVLLMITLLNRTLKGLFTSRSYVAVEVGSLYWHFVDFIWIFVFSTIFIIR
jgi:heme/copper-type cytochrome/quinol oxidase subunit 3